MAVDINRIAFAQREYRTAPPQEDLAVSVNHPLAVELEYNSLTRNETDASSLGDMILDLRKYDRWNWACFVKKGNYSPFEVGKTITIFYPRFGFDNGADFIIKRVQTDSNALFDELTLFGPRGSV